VSRVSLRQEIKRGFAWRGRHTVFEVRIEDAERLLIASLFLASAEEGLRLLFFPVLALDAGVRFVFVLSS
jgi:hypothetical protein